MALEVCRADASRATVWQCRYDAVTLEMRPPDSADVTLWRTPCATLSALFMFFRCIRVCNWVWSELEKGEFARKLPCNTTD
jgi:hypothetical protein